METRMNSFAASPTAPVDTEQTSTLAEVYAPTTPHPVIIFLIYLFPLLAICLNGILLLIVFYHSNLYKKINLHFVIHQAIIDAFTSFVFIISACVQFNIGSVSINQVTGEFYCRLIYSEVLIYIGFGLSLFNLSALATERYYMIKYPIAYKVNICRKRANIAVSLIWLLGVCIYIPAVVAVQFTESHCVQHNLFGYRWGQIVYSLVIAFFGIFGSGAYFIYVFVSCMRVLRQKRQIFPGDSSAGCSQSLPVIYHTAQINLFKIMVMAAATFIICWMPCHIYILLVYIGLPLTYHDGWYQICMILGVVNNCINPFIYILKIKEVKSICFKILQCKHCPNIVHTGSNMQSSPTTRLQMTSRPSIIQALST